MGINDIRGNMPNASRTSLAARVSLSRRPLFPQMAPTNVWSLPYIVTGNIVVMTSDDNCLLQSITVPRAPNDRLCTRYILQHTSRNLENSVLTLAANALWIVLLGITVDITVQRRVWTEVHLLLYVVLFDIVNDDVWSRSLAMLYNVSIIITIGLYDDLVAITLINECRSVISFIDALLNPNIPTDL